MARRIGLGDVCNACKDQLAINAWYGLSKQWGPRTFLIGEMRQGHIVYWMARLSDRRLVFKEIGETAPRPKPHDPGIGDRQTEML